MELVSTIEINGEEREIADAYARGQIATNAQNIATNTEGIAGLNNNLDTLAYGENSGNSNLFYGELKTDKKNGVTITKQEDGTYLLSGTASDTFFFRLGSFNFINGKEYYLSTSAKGSLGGTHFARIRNNADNNTEKNIIKNVKYTPNTTEKQWFDIVITNGTDVTNTVYKPMVSLMQYDYEPYIPSVKMLAEEVSAQNDSLDQLKSDLYEKLKVISVSLSDVMVSAMSSTTVDLPQEYIDAGYVIANILSKPDTGLNYTTGSETSIIIRNNTDRAVAFAPTTTVKVLIAKIG